MAALKEYRCAAHGPFENYDALCPHGCPRAFVKQEVRTAPAYQHKKTRFVDQQLRGIAQDAGLTNLKNDPKSGTSVMHELRKGAVQNSRWLGVQHAKPGFSQRKGETAPVFDPRSAGFIPPDKPLIRPGALPQPVPKIVGTYRE
jgi:hypothetical protein